MQTAACQTLVNLRREPSNVLCPLIMDPLQESQLLPGESVKVVEDNGVWAQVEALDQPYFNGSWGCYPGWVLKEALCTPVTPDAYIISMTESIPFGSRVLVQGQTGESIQTNLGSFPRTSLRLDTASIGDSRGAFLAYASAFLAMPYQWGGRSSYNPDLYPISSVDCSGLVNLSLWVMGHRVPRDAHDQWLKAKPVTAKSLKGGDLLFTAKASKPERISHVMILKNRESLIEASSDAGKVHEISIQEKLGISLDELENGTRYGDRLIWAGSLL